MRAPDLLIILAHLGISATVGSINRPNMSVGDHDKLRLRLTISATFREDAPGCAKGGVGVRAPGAPITQPLFSRL